MQPRTIQLEGETLPALHDGLHLFVPTRLACDRLGIAWQPQHRKIVATPELIADSETLDVRTGGGVHSMLCLTAHAFLAWLRTINVERLEDSARFRLDRWLPVMPAALDAAAKRFKDRCERRDALLARKDVRRILHFMDRRLPREDIDALMGADLVAEVWPELVAFGLLKAGA